MKKNLLIALLALAGCSPAGDPAGSEETAATDSVQLFLDDYNKRYQELITASSEAEWKLNTRIVEGDTLSALEARKASEELSAFAGSLSVIEKTKAYLARPAGLSPLQKKQLEAILYAAGANAESAADIVKARIRASTAQTEKLYGYVFKMDGREVTPNRIDSILKHSTNLSERLRAWEASKDVGKVLKPGLVDLRHLRNESVKPLGYSDYFNYQVSEYGMSTAELMQESKKMMSDIWPLYRELHTWARYELAARFRKPVPDLIPAHWLPNRWGQEWSGLVQSEGVSLDEALAAKGPEWIVKEGEAFYVSLGFPVLPESFYQKSSLYPVPAGADYKKNTHASAWHIDNAEDVRSLMSIEPNTEWWGTTLHELGHIYYYMSYTNPEVPVILRAGANRAYHEAMGSLMGLASLQKPFLEERGLIPAGLESDPIPGLMKEALDYIVLIPWSAGVMTHFEHDLYAEDLPETEFNKRWWELKRKYQGIGAPSERGEEYCDACSKTHINDDAAQYYDYAMSNVLLFQFHDHIAKNILRQDPHATNYWGSRETGDFLQKLMRPGASVDWRKHLQENLGSGMSAKPMMDYFAPLMEHLKKQNAGRTYTLPEQFPG